MFLHWPSIGHHVNTTIHQKFNDIMKVLFIDIKRSLYSTWNYELFGLYGKHAVSYMALQAKTEDQKDIMYNKLMKDINVISAKVKSSYKDFEVPHAKRLAAMPHQSTRQIVCKRISDFFLHCYL